MTMIWISWWGKGIFKKELNTKMLKRMSECEIAKEFSHYRYEVLAATPHKTLAVRPPTSHHENYQS